MSSMDTSAQDAASVTNLYHITPADLDRVRRFGELVIPNLQTYIEAFYEWLPSQPEFHELFTSDETLERVKRMQLEYWSDFFRGVVDENYLTGRRAVGEVHARIGLSLPAYFAAMNLMLENFCEGPEVEKLSLDERAAAVRAVTKQIHLDTALVVDTFSRLTTERITEQSRSLIAMSTPVTAIWRDVLLLPIVGVVDSKRSQDIMSAMLSKIAEAHAKVIILDISGVAIVDTAVANHLIKITKATKLMGCECTISGVSPAIAQTIVELGIEVGEVRTTATLRDALEAAFRDVGIAIADAR
jgi:rsbT co-antagonist protein RsbR